MSYRDELGAAHARIQQLERELADAGQERDRLIAELAETRRRLEAVRTGEQLNRAALICNACGGRNTSGAAHCALCGESLRAVATTAGRRVDCPRCSVGTEPVNIGALTVQACTACGGVWLGAEQMEDLLAQARTDALNFDPSVLDLVWDGGGRVERGRYIRCPVCSGIMERKVHGDSGVIVDLCSTRHGVWMDRGELPRVVKWEQANPGGGRRRERGSTRSPGLGGEPVGMLDWLGGFLGAKVNRRPGGR